MENSIEIRATDRLTFTLFLAIAAHVLLIFGVGFTLHTGKNDADVLDVMAAVHEAETPDEAADFLAQSNQAGSGTEDEARRVTTTETAQFEDNSINKVNDDPQALLIKDRPIVDNRIISSRAPSRNTVIKLTLVDDPLVGNATEDSLPEQPTYDIATLKAMLSDQQQRYAARPRVRTLTAASTKAASEAAYVVEWLDKVERIGNLNYPSVARQQKLTGSVRLLVVITPSGAAKRVEVLESSGHSILDDAAKRVARLASPYAPFTEDMRSEFDELEIIRTWRFISTLTLDF
jgi:protein TonB